jgi:ribosomal protein S18 acetylase RimI-like enzyme
MMQIGHDGIRPYVEQQIQWDQSDQERRFREDFELDLISIITTDDGNIGYLKVERREDHIWLCGLYLDRDYRSRGIGSDIVSNLLAQCRSLQLPLRLRVLSQNPARHMYERLGFRVVEESGSHVYLEADPREV